MISYLLIGAGLPALAAGLGVAQYRRFNNKADTADVSVGHSGLSAERFNTMKEELEAIYDMRIRRNSKLRRGTSFPRKMIEAHCPELNALYTDPVFIRDTENAFGLEAGSLKTISPDNQQSFCVYCYDAPGDFIGWHFDKPAYNSVRYNVLLCLEDTSDAMFQTRKNSLQLQPGQVLYFIGERTRHRVTPVGGTGQRRILLNLEYVMDNSPTTFFRTWYRKITDRIFYFG